MELVEYLNQTKNRRGELVKQASKYLQKIHENDLKIITDQSYNESIYNGPQPLKLKEYEKSINSQLQKIYRDGFDATVTCKYDMPKSESTNERIIRIYSKEMTRINRKQLTIIPKYIHSKNIKSILPIKQSRFINSSSIVKKRLQAEHSLLSSSNQNVSLPSISSNTTNKALS